MGLSEIERFFVLTWSMAPKRIAQGTVKLEEEQIREIEAKVKSLDSEFKVHEDDIFYQIRSEEIQRIAVEADILIKRFEERYNRRLSSYDKVDKFRWFLTESSFRVGLAQYGIASVHNDPLIPEWRALYKFDFEIPIFGRIDIKSATLNKDPTIPKNEIEEGVKHGSTHFVGFQILESSYDLIDYFVKKNEKGQPIKEIPGRIWLQLHGYLSSEEIKKNYELKPPKTPHQDFYYEIPIEDFQGKEKQKRSWILLKNLNKFADITKSLELFWRTSGISKELLGPNAQKFLERMWKEIRKERM